MRSVFATCAGLLLGMGVVSMVATRADEPANVTLPPAAERQVDFEQDVRPLLVERCYKCHGPKKQESGLRFDQRDAALRGGDAYGPPVTPSNSAESLLIAAVAGTHADLPRMPPEEEPLSTESIGVLRAWIDQGANWPQDSTAKPAATEHWAFKPPVRPALPEVTNGDWPRGAIDRFVLARLEAEGLASSVEADRYTLLRRLSLDLIGLPPTIEEVDAFVADSSPDAYEKQVERLLASPHYGERWGRHWLDASRYADSDGYEKDKSRNVWFYRDWVVHAFNRDLPYDQFVIEQLAGDLLEGATQDQVVATGFLRNSMLNEEGGVDPEQFRMDAMFDRMDCLGKAVLGLTIQCAQCHTHKFDPLTQEEYYRLFAFLNNDHEPMRVVYSAEEQAAAADLLSQIEVVRDEIKHQTPDWGERMAAWEAAQLAAEPAWTVLEPVEYGETGGGAKLSLLTDQSMLCAGYAPTHCTFRATSKAPISKVTAIRLEVLTNPNLPCGGPGRSFKGTFGLTEIKLERIAADEAKTRTELKLAAASADYSQEKSPLEPAFDDRRGKERFVGPVAMAIDGKDDTAWGIDAGPGRRNQDRTAVFQLETPLETHDGEQLAVSLVQNHGGWNSDDHQNNLIGCFRLSVTDADGAATREPLPKAVLEALCVPREMRTPRQQTIVFDTFRKSVAEWADANAKIEVLWQQWPAGSTALTLMAREQSRETKVLARGDFLHPSRPVEPGVPAFLHPLPEDAPPTRLTLARWLVDRRSPTTARVFVNRVWQAYFGNGLVSTSEDFGIQAEAPSHPELLDWLACEFMDQGWSIKALHRLIVGSATYRQTSHASPELYARDPQNRLLARGSRFRVEGEIVHDIALSASGLLVPKLGGPSVFPPIPESVLGLSYGPMTWNAATGPDRYRRAIYTFRRRSIPFPALQNFDVPNGDFACVRRVRSDTPLQALTSLNEVVFIESARELARQALLHGANDPERLRYAFRRCVSRPPDDEELAELTSLLAKQRTRLAEGWTSPLVLATGKQEQLDRLPPGATPTDWGAYTVVARVLLNLDETITKE